MGLPEEAEPLSAGDVIADGFQRLLILSFGPSLPRQLDWAERLCGAGRRMDVEWV